MLGRSSRRIMCRLGLDLETGDEVEVDELGWDCVD
jgi:hypothetical protein